MTKTIDILRAALNGELLSATIALAVRFVSDRLGGPAMLYALLCGMAFNFLSEDERFAIGIRVACLQRVVIAISHLMRRGRTPESGNLPLLPWFRVRNTRHSQQFRLGSDRSACYVCSDFELVSAHGSRRSRGQDVA